MALIFSSPFDLPFYPQAAAIKALFGSGLEFPAQGQEFRSLLPNETP